MSARFVWYELVTSDVDTALPFYAALFGWDANDFPGGEGRYVIVSAKGRGVGGVMPLPEGMTQPFWLGYVGTPDIDGAVASFERGGGRVHRGPWEIPAVGRLALLSDPQGAALAMIQGASDRPSEAFDRSRPGHGNWHELVTNDPEAAFAFYAGQFGWAKGDTHPMGAMGSYQLFRSDGTDIGGIAQTPPSAPPSWLYYFGVESVERTASLIWENGGTVRHGPSEVPGGGHIIQATDPQGAPFAVVGP